MDFLFQLVIFWPPYISCASSYHDEVANQSETQ